MILKNSKGAALMQVLLVTIVLAGMSAMLLRATLSRTMTVRHVVAVVGHAIRADSGTRKEPPPWPVPQTTTLQVNHHRDGPLSRSRPRRVVGRASGSSPCAAWSSADSSPSSSRPPTSTWA